MERLKFTDDHRKPIKPLKSKDNALAGNIQTYAKSKRGPAVAGRNLLDHWILARYPKVYLLQSGKGENQILNK